MEPVLTQVATILLLGVVLKIAAARLKFPEIVLFILGGTFLVSYGLVDLTGLGPLPELVRTVALIIVVFSAGFYLKISEIREQGKNIVFLATMGVLLTALIIAFTTFSLLSIALPAALFLGVLLCGTDPAAVSSTSYKNSEKPNRVLTILNAESLFNSPFTVILPLLLLDYMVQPELAWLSVPTLASLIIMGGIVGFAAAKIGGWVLRFARSEHTEIIGLMIAMVSYVVSENLLGSGILAVAVCSILISSEKIPHKRWMGEFNKGLALLFTIFVFVMLGAQFSFEQLIFTRMEIFTIIIALIAGRLFTSLLLLMRSGLSLNEKLKIGLIAPKGMAPAALAPLLLAPGLMIAGAESVVKIVYVAIVISILISLIVMRLFVVPKEEEKSMKEQLEEKRNEREGKEGGESDGE
ncbi:MAG: cation:proton antiporter [Candidatus Diapherotrites archaeon]